MLQYLCHVSFDWTCNRWSCSNRCIFMWPLDGIRASNLSSLRVGSLVACTQFESINSSCSAAAHCCLMCASFSSEWALLYGSPSASWCLRGGPTFKCSSRFRTQLEQQSAKRTIRKRAKRQSNNQVIYFRWHSPRQTISFPSCAINASQLLMINSQTRTRVVVLYCSPLNRLYLAFAVLFLFIYFLLIQLPFTKGLHDLECCCFYLFIYSLFFFCLFACPRVEAAVAMFVFSTNRDKKIWLWTSGAGAAEDWCSRVRCRVQNWREIFIFYPS